MTATEVEVRQEEKMAMLGPVIERFQNEALDPLIDRTFEKCLEFGVLPPPPPELYGVNLEVEYVSVLAQAQKAINSVSTDRFIMSISQVAQFKPEVLDKLDGDAIVDEYHGNYGVSPKLLLTDEEVAALREQRAQQQQMMQQQAAIESGATAAKAAKDMGDTPMDTGSALDAFLGGIPSA